jgi:hypothetical protein
VEAGPRARRGPGAADRAAGADRVREDVDRPPGAGEPTRSLRRAECHKIFHEQISTRVTRPELEKALALAHQLKACGIQLELLTDPLTGIYDPNGIGAMFFALLAGAGQIERHYIREKTLEGQVIGAAKGNHGGRPKVDDDSLTCALALKDKGVPSRTSRRSSPSRPGRTRASPRPPPPSTGRSQKPSRPPRTTTCRSGPSPSVSGTPTTR